MHHHHFSLWVMFGVMVFSATFNNSSAILWLSVLLVEETGVPGKNHPHVSGFEFITLVMIGTDCICTILLYYHDNYIVLTIMVIQIVYMNSIKKLMIYKIIEEITVFYIL